MRRFEVATAKNRSLRDDRWPRWSASSASGAGRHTAGSIAARNAVALLLVLPALLLSRPVLAQDPQTAPSVSDIAAKIDAILDAPALNAGFQGVVVQSLDSGKVWYQRNADRLFLPASNQKLLTSAAVLSALGPDYRYETLLLRAGNLDESGTLHGNLYLVGSGDPLLADKDLDSLVAQAQSAGIKRVDGHLVGDDTRFDRQRYGGGWAWDDMPYYYAAEVSALNLDENVVTITLDPGRRAGDPVRVGVTPTGRYAHVIVRARTVEQGGASALRVGRELGTNDITVEGTLALDAKPADHRPARVTIDDPTRFTATCLQEKLGAAGIDVTGGVEEGAAPHNGATEVARHSSPPMSDILPLLLKPSDNLVAECLLRTLAAARGKLPASAGDGAALATAWLKSIGVDPVGVDMADGSGLSREDYVTPRTMVALLAAMKSQPNGRLWMDALPIAGVDGTLRRRMKGTPAENNCRAKTGSLSSVSSLSGYVITRDGEPLAFSILMNNHRGPESTATGAQDRVVELLAGWSGRVAERTAGR